MARSARSRLLVACLLAVGLAACSTAHGSAPQDMATGVAQGIYNNDLGAATANFDDTLKGQATRTEIAVISDKMHALGSFQGLTETKHDDDSRRYWYDAKFSNGDMTVEMRLHANGQIAAYRIIAK